MTRVNEKYYLENAEKIWYADWLKAGSPDEGSCTGGKGLYLKDNPGWKYHSPEIVVSGPPCQGNLGAARTRHGAIKYLAENGIEVSYYDGWMD